MSDADAYAMNIAYVVLFAIFVAFFFIAVYIHTVVHEFGHLFGGLLSGCKFISFRVYKMMFIFENGALSRKRHTVGGAGGHCMMLPPERADGEFPFVFFLLSGSLMNFLACVIFYALSRVIVVENVPYITLFFHCLIFVGLPIGLINIMPIKMKKNANDGYSAYLLKKHMDARQTYRDTLRIVSGMTQGIRFKDMPADWFPAPESIDNTQTAEAALRRFDLMMDNHRYAEAREIGEKTLEEGRNVLSLQRYELACELLFIEIIGERRQDVMENYLTGDLLKHIKSYKYHLSKHRLVYAYEKLISRDSKKASAALKKFNKLLSRYPYAGEMEHERELIAVVDSAVRIAMSTG